MQDCTKIFIKLLWSRSVCCRVLKKQTIKKNTIAFVLLICVLMSVQLDVHGNAITCLMRHSSSSVHSQYAWFYVLLAANDTVILH